MEIKKLTGRTFKPFEYKKLTKCVVCGIVVPNKCKDNNCKDTDTPCKSHYCETCSLVKLDRCKYCTGVFHDKPFLSYTYDIRELKRDNGLEFKVSKVLIREFKYMKEPVFLRFKKDICIDCADIKDRIKNHCFTCGNEFKNSLFNRIKNGNMCEFCVFRYDEMEKSMIVSLEVM